MFIETEKQDDQQGGYFGVCPHCFKTDGYINIGGNHWFSCEQHGVRWCAGWNLFSDWKDETEAEQEEIANSIASAGAQAGIYSPIGKTRPKRSRRKSSIGLISGVTPKSKLLTWKRSEQLKPLPTKKGE